MIWQIASALLFAISVYILTCKNCLYFPGSGLFCEYHCAFLHTFVTAKNLYFSIVLLVIALLKTQDYMSLCPRCFPWPAREIKLSWLCASQDPLFHLYSSNIFTVELLFIYLYLSIHTR